MLIRYYITSVIIWWIMVFVWQPLWALVPAILMIIMATGSIQSHHNSMHSLQQFATDNIMLLSWITLMVWVSWMMYLAWYDLLVSMIWISIVTIISYYISLALDYTDGIIVRHQASIVSIAAIAVSLIIYTISDMSMMQWYWGIASIYMTIIGSIMISYYIASHITHWSLPHHLRDETILVWALMIPLSVIATIFSHDIIRACLIWLLIYQAYWRWLSHLSHYHYPTTNNQELTLDLILKWYKTTQISHLTRRSWVNTIFDHLSQIQPIIHTIIQRIPDIIMAIAYWYFITHLIQWGILMSDFMVYLLSFISYVSLGYVYERSDSINIDTIAQSFIFWYLSILALMITVFASDPVTGSIVGIIWVVINALVVSQYHRLQLSDYMQAHHVQRRVRANTAGAAIILWVMVQLPIDSIMIIPIILITIAILWFTIAQSYITLRTLTK